MRVTLVHNPKAGGGEHTADSLLAVLDDAGYEAAYLSAKEKDYAAGLEDPGGLVIVAGGDGTVRQISSHLAGRGIPIGLIPLGTANNISVSLGVRGDPRTLIAGWASARRRRMDLGVASGPWGETHFIEAVGLGLFPQTMLSVEEMKASAGSDPGRPRTELIRDLRALMRRLRTQRAEELWMTVDGRDVSGRYLMVEVMNTTCIGPNLVLAPGADPADGRLDVVLVTDRERGTLEAYIESRLEGGNGAPRLPVIPARSLEIAWDGAVIHLDDELWPRPGAEEEEGAAPSTMRGAAMTLRLQRHALEFLVPREAIGRAD